MGATYEGRSSGRIMSITYSTSNERNVILERALLGFLSLMLIGVGKAVAMSIALKLGTSGQ